MCRPRSRPIVAIKVAESPAFGRASMRWFHTFEAGKTGQPGAPGSDGAPPCRSMDGSPDRADPSRPGPRPCRVNPSPSVSTLFGWVPRFCSLRLLRPSLSRSSFASGRRSPSVSALRGWTTARGSLQFHRPSWSGSSTVVGAAVAVAVLLLRVRLREVLVPIGQPVAVRILLGVRQAVPVGVLRGRARPRAIALERCRAGRRGRCRSRPAHRCRQERAQQERRPPRRARTADGIAMPVAHQSAIRASGHRRRDPAGSPDGCRAMRGADTCGTGQLLKST